MQKVKILNVEMQSITQKELLQTLKKGVLTTPNVDHLIKLQKDRLFYDIYQKADCVVCDSQIIALGAKFLGTPIKEVIPGSSFFSAYYEYHKKNKEVTIFLLGAAAGVAEKAKERINRYIGRDIIVGAHSPSFGFEKDEKECMEIVDYINKTNATVLLVGVGAPKQEKWIFKYKDQLPNINLFLPLGATIDFEAGNIKRAPKIFQKLALEWLYRMFMDPKRLIKRYLVDDIPFFYLLVKQRFGLYRNPFE
ncbi:MAG: WecB/TagA/CpsF family glycosyltransferase [Prevotella sp.]|jgi:exopolysaccharide biosynthesis WecB/TagA/CpsF family protein|nr:WecB/TagA/CpsF family glycosyltransferase [Prevotella sp.]